MKMLVRPLDERQLGWMRAHSQQIISLNDIFISPLEDMYVAAFELERSLTRAVN